MARRIALFCAAAAAAVSGAVAATASTVDVPCFNSAVISARTGKVDPRFSRLRIDAAVADGRGGWWVGGRGGVARLSAGGRLGADLGRRYHGQYSRLLRRGTILYATGQFGAVAVDDTTGRTLWRFSKRSLYGATIGGQRLFAVTNSDGFVALDIRTGRPVRWGRWTSSHETVESLAVGDGALFRGGPGGVEMIDLRTAQPVWHPRWPPFLGTEVLHLAFLHDTLLAGGLHGQADFAAFDPRTGRPARWFPLVKGLAGAFAVSGSRLYLGGDLQLTLSGIGPFSLNNLGALRLPEGPAVNWTPDIEKFVSVGEIVPSGDKVLVTGQFCSNLG